MRSRDYTKKNKTVPTNSILHKIGDRVYGVRKPNTYVGELVETYATLNNGYKNNKQCPIVLIDRFLIYVTDHQNHESLLRYLTDQGYEEQLDLDLLKCVIDVVEERYDSVSYWTTPTLEQWLENS